MAAIESRDPTTWGHSRRVAPLGGARQGGRRRPTGRSRTCASRAGAAQIEYAGLLHDFGKVGVREKVLVKAKKLYEEELRDIELRFASSAALEADTPAQAAPGAGARRADVAARFAALDAETGRRLASSTTRWRSSARQRAHGAASRAASSA